MDESANTDLRTARRQATARRINQCARDLTLARGLDGFSMDDLAEAADVSRRTLFNYFSGKDAAVLGEELPFSPEAEAAFLSGGPHGDLVDDLAALVMSLLDRPELGREEITQFRDLMSTEPRLLALVHERFQHRVDEALRHIEKREGPAYDAAAARTVVHLMAALFDHALMRFVEQPERTLADLFTECVAHARAAFTH